MKTKKPLITFLAMLLTVMLLSACGGGGGAAEEIRLTMATGGTAGTYYPLGGAMAAVINSHTNLNIAANASGASGDNIRQIAAGDAHLALAQNDIMSYAFHGTNLWEGHEPVTNLATLMTLYPETIQVVVEAGSGIYNIRDLAGMRVSIGDVGSGTAENARQVLEAHGIGLDDINRFDLSFGASADQMRDGMIDAFFVTAATPNTAIMELATARDLRILTIEPDMVQALLNAHAFLVPVTIPVGEYAFITEPVNTIAVQATLVTSLDMDEQIAYDIVRVLIEYAHEVEQRHARGAYFTPFNAVQSIAVDLHPGARRFFEGIGALD